MQNVFDRITPSLKKDLVNVSFIPLFGALLLIFRIGLNTDWTIHEWNGIISWATSENLDINRRIASFYTCFAMFFLAFFFFLFLLLRLGKRIFFESELSILNYASLLGCILLFFKLTGTNVNASLMLLLVLQLLVGMYALTDFFTSGSKRIHALPLAVLAWSLITGISVYFFIDYTFLLFNFNAGKYFAPLIFILSAIAVQYSYHLGRKEKSIELIKWMISSRYVVLIPFLLVLSQELYMILNQHGITLIHPAVIFFSFTLAIAALIAASKRRKQVAEITEASVNKTISDFFLPWLLAGLIAFSFYHPIIEPTQELFEEGIPALSIQQFYEFGKIPWLQTFSSHSGADFISGFIYTFFNGFSGLSYHCYDFLYEIVYALLCYFILLRLTNSGYCAFLTVMLYPYIFHLLPPYFSVVPLSLLALSSALNHPNTKNYFFLFSSLILMLFWRYDIAYAAFFALLISLLIYIILHKNIRSNFRAALRGFLYALILPVSLLLFAILKNRKSILINIQDALAYINSTQAYGMNDLAGEKNMLYHIHYFVFPALMACCFLYALFQLAFSLKKNDKISFLNLSQLFLVLFYFFNFHRGLIRHNLAEGWDTAFSSFAFFIASLTVYDFLKSKTRILQFAVAGAFATLILVAFKVPAPEASRNNYFAELTRALNAPPLAAVTDIKIDRAQVKPEFAKENFLEFKNFLDKNFSPDATFLDFTNSPMLYFYTHRQTINYFNQIPHNAHNAFLQQRFLEDLKQYKVPVVVFSNYPEQWGDNFDGIPNSYRHYLIAEYIYKHYQPYAIMNHHCVWLEKGNKLLTEAHPDYSADNFSDIPKDQNLKLLPYVMGKFFKDTFNVYQKSSSYQPGDTATLNFSMPPAEGKEFFLAVKAKNGAGKNIPVHIVYGNKDQVNGIFRFSLVENSDAQTYLIRLSTQYNWNSKPNDSIRLIVDEGKCEVKELSLLGAD